MPRVPLERPAISVASTSEATEPAAAVADAAAAPPSPSAAALAVVDRPKPTATIAAVRTVSPEVPPSPGPELAALEDSGETTYVPVRSEQHIALYRNDGPLDAERLAQGSNHVNDRLASLTGNSARGWTIAR